MVGRLSIERRNQVIDLLHGMVDQETADVVDVLVQWMGDVQVDEAALAIDIDAFIDQYHGLSLQQLNLAAMLMDLTVILREHQLNLPPDLALLFKVFITLEGLGGQLDPDFGMAAQAGPFIRSALRARYMPDAIAKRGWRGLTETVDILTGLPRDLRKLLSAARRGAIQVHIDITRLKRFGDQLDRAASRLTVGTVTAALIIGSSIVMTIKGGPTLFELPMFGVLGFSAAVIGGIWLLISIWRSGRHKE